MTGVLDYFPDAIAAVAEASRLGNDQHAPGEPLHWARGKSTDQLNTAVRHMIQRGGRDTDGGRHLAKAAWRILAALQEEIEAEHRSDTIPAPSPDGTVPYECEHGRTYADECEHGRTYSQECLSCGRLGPGGSL